MGHPVKLTFTNQIPFKLSFNKTNSSIIPELYDTLKNGDIIFVDAYIDERHGAKEPYIEPYVVEEKKGYVQCVFTTHWEQIGTTQLEGQLFPLCPSDCSCIGNCSGKYTYTVPIYAGKLYIPDIFETDELIIYTPSTVFTNELFNAPSIERYLELKMLENPQKYALLYMMREYFSYRPIKRVGNTYYPLIDRQDYLCAVLNNNSDYVNFYLEKSAILYSPDRLSLRQICNLGYIGYGVGLSPRGFFNRHDGSGEDRFEYLIRGKSIWCSFFQFNSFNFVFYSHRFQCNTPSAIMFVWNKTALSGIRYHEYYHWYEYIDPEIWVCHCKLEEDIGGEHYVISVSPLCNYHPNGCYVYHKLFGLYRLLYDKKNKKLFFISLLRDITVVDVDVHYCSKQEEMELGFFGNGGFSYYDLTWRNIDVPDSWGFYDGNVGEELQIIFSY